MQQIIIIIVKNGRFVIYKLSLCFVIVLIDRNVIIELIIVLIDLLSNIME